MSSSAISAGNGSKTRGYRGGLEIWGTQPAAYLASQGQRLEALDAVPGAEHLIEKLRARDPSAWAEVTAIWLLRHDDHQVELEVEQPVTDWPKIPDFRARRAGSPWTYVEVTQPNLSQEQKRLRRIMARVSDVTNAVEGTYALEVFLHRAPSTAELDELLQRIPEVCRMRGQQQVELPAGLGTLFLNDTQPGVLVLENRDEIYRPRLGLARSAVENGVTQRHIAIRLGYSDERADQILRAEARQLPKSHPGLIMMQTSGATGGFRVWKPILQSRLHPGQHTRVGGIALFESGMLTNSHGLPEWRPETNVIKNRHAAIPLPSWIDDNLARHQAVQTTA
jgi:hypothetical protein